MLSKRLISLRKQKGISQYEAARRLNFSRGKLANYEQGSREPDYDTLISLADFYNVSIDYLLGRNKKDKESEEEEEMMFAVGGFDTEGMTEDEIEYMKKWTKEELEKYREAKKQWEEMQRLYEEDKD